MAFYFIDISISKYLVIKMKKTILLRLSVIVSVWLCFAGLSFAAYDQFPVPSGEFGMEKLSEQQRKKKMHKFQEDRLNYIVEIADLNSDEREWLDLELKKFDNARAEVWIEMRKVRSTIEKSGADVTDQKYTECLNNLITLHQKMGEIHERFVKELQNKFTPKKAYITFDGIRSYNDRVAKKVRRD